MAVASGEWKNGKLQTSLIYFKENGCKFIALIFPKRMKGVEEGGGGYNEGLSQS